MSEIFGRFRQTVLVSRREYPAAPESQQIVDLALSPAMILDGEGIYAGIYANIANKEIGSLDKMRDLIFTPFAEAASGICHRRVPSIEPALQKYLGAGRGMASVLIHQHQCPNWDSTKNAL